MRRAVIDANLIVLLTVGAVSPDLIGRHRRLRDFKPADLDLLTVALQTFGGLILCPNVLTEASNLLRYDRRSADLTSGALAALISAFGETYLPSSEVVQSPQFSRLGLADAVLLRLADSGATLFTVDVDLYLAAVRAGSSAVNFNHLRSATR